MQFLNFNTNHIRNNVFKYVFLFSTLFFISLSFILPIRFEDNDDVIMLLFASGQYTGTPEFRLVFINSIFGLILMFLYRITNIIEWYTLLFSIFHIISLSIIIWSLIKKNTIFIWKLSFVFIFLIIESRFIAQFQFTTTAAITALAGLILCSRSENTNRIYGMVLFSIASLIRFEASILVFILYLPSIIYNPKYKKIVDLKHYFILFTLVIGLYSANNLSYKIDDEWNTYFELNNIRGKINDNPNSNILKFNSRIEQINHKLILESFIDSEKLGLITITSIYKKYRMVNILEKIHNIYPAIVRYSRIYLIITLIILLTFLSTNKKIYLFNIAILFFIISISISLNGSLKERVFYSSVLPILYLLSEFNIDKTKFVSKIGVIVLLSYMNIFMFYRTVKISNRNISYYNDVFLVQKDFLFDFFDKSNFSIIPYASSFNFQSLAPFSVSNVLKNKNIVFFGWVSGIPYNSDKITSHLDFLDNSAIFTSNESFNNLTEILNMHFLYNYNLSTSVYVIKEDSNYKIFKFINANSNCY